MPEKFTPISPGFTAWACICLTLTAVYSVVFSVTETLVTAREIALWSVSNALPHTLLAVPLVDRFAPSLAQRRILVALAAATGVVILYALVAYCGAIFLLAMTGGVRTEGILVRFFAGPALPWQMFQGCAYGCIAIFAGLWLDTRGRFQKLRDAPVLTPTEPRSQRWLVKTSEGIVPIDPGEIVRIQAAGEYAQIVLPTSTTLSRIGMTACEQRLAGLPFLRVHRSHLVHADAIMRAEPAGNGRLQLDLSNGDKVITSREGARLVRGTAI